MYLAFSLSLSLFPDETEIRELDGKHDTVRGLSNFLGGAAPL